MGGRGDRIKHITEKETELQNVCKEGWEESQWSDADSLQRQEVASLARGGCGGRHLPSLFTK